MDKEIWGNVKWYSIILDYINDKLERLVRFSKLINPRNVLFLECQNTFTLFRFKYVEKSRNVRFQSSVLSCIDIALGKQLIGLTDRLIFLHLFNDG